MTTTRLGNAPGKFAVTVAFELHASGFDEFHALVCENAAQSTAREPDCLRFDVLLPMEQTGSALLLYELYADRAAFDLHLETEHYRAFDARSRHLVRAKTVTTFTVFEGVSSGKPL